VPSPPQLVISTHFDDAVLSLAHVLQRAGPRATVVTVCGGAPVCEEPASEWDAEGGFTSAAEAARTRVQEDREACALTGARAHPLSHADTPYEAMPAASILRGEIEPLLEPGCVLWLPAGIGNEDHSHVRDALLPLAAGLPAASVRFYADLPYAARIGWDLPEDLAPAHRHLRARDVQVRGAAFERKLAAVGRHASQVPLLATRAERFLAHDGPLARERVWSRA
jgi:hypothetical protein